MSASRPASLVERAPKRAAASVGVATAILLLVLLLGALPRLIDLDGVPLSPAEAGEALAAWSLFAPAPEREPTSPAYVSLTGLLMALVGDNDVTARLVPALFGVALAGLPWLLRRQLGTAGALVAALVLAVSPLATVVARTADGAGLALTAGLLFFISVRRYTEHGAPQWLYLAAGALGLGLTTAPVFYGALLTLLAARLAAVASGSGAPALPRAAAGTARVAAYIAMGTALALAMTFGWRIAGLGDAGDLLARWLSQFGLRADLVAWAGPLLLLVRYEPAVFLLGLLAILWAGSDGGELNMLLTFWFVATLLMLAVQPGVRENSALAVIPGSLLIGRFTQATIRRRGTAPAWQLWGLSGLFLFLFAAGLANLVRHVRVEALNPTQVSYLWVTVVILALGLAVAVFLALSDPRLTAGSVYLASLAFLLFIGYGGSWWLGRVAANDTRTLWVDVATDDELPLLERSVRELSQTITRSEHDLTLWSTVESDVLRWIWRDHAAIQFGAVVPPGASPDAVLTPVDAGLELAEDYVGSDFGLLRLDSGQPIGLQHNLPGWMFHEASTAMPESRVVLWVRANLLRE